MNHISRFGLFYVMWNQMISFLVNVLGNFTCFSVLNMFDQSRN